MSAISCSSVTRTSNHGRDAAAARRTATRSSRRGRSTDSLVRARRDTTRWTSSSSHCVRATSATARWPRVSGLKEPGNAPLRIGPATDAPAVVTPVEHHERSGREAEERPVGVAGDEKPNETLDMGEMPDKHYVFAFGLESGRPSRRVVVGRQAVGLRGRDAEQLSPDLGRLPGPGLVGMEDASRLNGELLHRARGDAAHAVNPGVGQPALGVDLRALRFAVTNEIGAHMFTL